MCAAPSIADPLPNTFGTSKLEQVFADCFSLQFNTRLAGGREEPIYVPAQTADDCHWLFYREDYFASALHEIAHWCIAGEERRLQLDFGYWYAPEGRNEAQQRAFEKVECKPQALEWFFSRACGWRFNTSRDNLDETGTEPAGGEQFAQQVYEQVLCWQDRGLPQRAGLFFSALSKAFGTSGVPQTLSFSLSELRDV